jgi:hypothetical protein
VVQCGENFEKKGSKGLDLLMREVETWSKGLDLLHRAGLKSWSKGSIY